MKKIKGEITNENENTAYQNLQNTVLRGEFIAIQAQLKKQEKSK